MTTPADVMKMAKDNGVKIVDFRFCDLLGTWQHTSKSSPMSMRKSSRMVLVSMDPPFADSRASKRPTC